MNKKELIEYIRAYYPEDQITFYDDGLSISFYGYNDGFYYIFLNDDRIKIWTDFTIFSDSCYPYSIHPFNCEDYRLDGFTQEQLKSSLLLIHENFKKIKIKVLQNKRKMLQDKIEKL